MSVGSGTAFGEGTFCTCFDGRMTVGGSFSGFVGSFGSCLGIESWLSYGFSISMSATIPSTASQTASISLHPALSYTETTSLACVYIPTSHPLSA